MKKVLITGAVGQDGLILSDIFINKKYKVFGIIKNKHSNKFKNNKVEYLINDLNLKNKIKKHLKIINPDIVIHLASSNSTFSKRLKKDNYKINYLKNLNYTKNLVNSIVELNLNCKFIFAGSSLMFENLKKKKVNEKDKFKSNSYYGMYKISAYRYIESMKKKKKINATTAILFNHDSTYRNKSFLIPKLINAFKKKKLKYIEHIYKLNICGDFSHAKDICNGLFKLSIYKKNIDKIIFSSGKKICINSVIQYLEKIYNLKLKRNVIKNKDNLKILGSNSLAKKLLKFNNTKNIFNVCDEIINSYSKFNLRCK